MTLLDIFCRLDVVNPFLSIREKHIQEKGEAMEKYKNLFSPVVSPQVPVHDSLVELNATMSNLSLGTKQTFILNDLHECEICKTPYEKKGRLKNHLVEKHGVEESSVFFWCEACAQEIPDQKKFTRHMKSHM